MTNAHDLAIIAFRRDFEAGGNRLSLDGERVIPRRGERRWQSAEYALAVMPYRRELAMHDALRPHDVSPERLPDRLVPQAHAQNWHLARETLNKGHRDARLVRCARSRRNDDLLRSPGSDLRERNGIVTM